MALIEKIEAGMELEPLPSYFKLEILQLFFISLKFRNNPQNLNLVSVNFQYLLL